MASGALETVEVKIANIMMKTRNGPCDYRGSTTIIGFVFPPLGVGLLGSSLPVLDWSGRAFNGDGGLGTAVFAEELLVHGRQTKLSFVL